MPEKEIVGSGSLKLALSDKQTNDVANNGHKDDDDEANARWHGK